MTTDSVLANFPCNTFIASITAAVFCNGQKTLRGVQAVFPLLLARNPVRTAHKVSNIAVIHQYLKFITLVGL